MNRWPAGRRLACLGLALGLALACNRVPAASEQDKPQTLVELRDAQGQPTFTLERVGESFRYVEPDGGSGRVIPTAGGFRGEDAARGPLQARRLEGGGVEIRGREGMLLRLTREGGSWRLGDGAGIPLARVRLDERAGEAVGHDPGGMVIIRVKAGGGRLVVSDRDGGTRALITGKLDQLSLTKAALGALPSLGGAERALLLVAAGG
jgi:hypothetical protein